MLRSFWRSRPVQLLLGLLLAGYLRLVRATSRILVEEGSYARLDEAAPAILASWHGQHFLTPFLKRPHDRFNVLISRHGDGEMNAIAVERLGIGLVRGSGAHRAHQVRKRGGARAMREMLEVLARGECMALTADVPKVARVAGRGIVLLARLSGRPIVPVAAVSSNRIAFSSWDRACIGLPFGRCALVIGQPIRVPADADEAALERVRHAVEAEADAVLRRAYAMVGSVDPGADRAEVAAARLAPYSGPMSAREDRAS